MRAAAFILALALAACSNVEAGDEAGGVIASSGPPRAVQASADSHCGKYGKVARIGPIRRLAGGNSRARRRSRIPRGMMAITRARAAATVPGPGAR